jgi:hypothetical protein
VHNLRIASAYYPIWGGIIAEFEEVDVPYPSGAGDSSPPCDLAGEEFAGLRGRKVPLQVWTSEGKDSFDGVCIIYDPRKQTGKSKKIMPPLATTSDKPLRSGGLATGEEGHGVGQAIPPARTGD